MERKELVEGLKGVVNFGTIVAARENAWLESFMAYAIESIDYTVEQSEASQAVSVFVALCRESGLWAAKVTPLSFRRKCRKESRSEPPLVTSLCRLEGKIRDIFRAPRRSAASGSGNGNDSLEGGNGNDSLEGGNGNDSLEGGSVTITTEEAKRKYRNEGKLVILFAIRHWVSERKTISKKSLLDEIERMEEGLQQQV